MRSSNIVLAVGAWVHCEAVLQGTRRPNCGTAIVVRGRL